MTATRNFAVWFWVALLVFVLMLIHQSNPATLLGRYSLNYAFLLGITGATVIFALTGYVLARRYRLPQLVLPSHRRLSFVILVMGMVGLVVWWFVPLTIYLPAIALFRVYIASLIIGVTLLALTTQPLVVLPALNWQAQVALGVFTFMVLIGVLWVFLGHVPPTQYYDEVILADWSLTGARTGDFFHIASIPTRTVASLPPTLATVWMGAWLNAVGVSLQSARLWSVLVAWLAVPFVAMTTKKLFGQGVVVFAVGIALILPIAHSYVRWDSVVTVCVAVALWLYFCWGQRSLAHFLIGFVLAFSIEGHQLAVRFGLTVGIWISLQYLLVMWRAKRVTFFAPFFLIAGGAITYAIIYLLLRMAWSHVDLAGYIKLLSQSYQTEVTIGGTTTFIERLALNFRMWLGNYVSLFPIDILLIALGMWAAWFRRASHDKILVGWLLLSMALYILISPKSPPYYYIHHIPFVALLGAGFVAHLTPKQRWWTVSVGALIGVLVLAQFSLVSRDLGVDDVLAVGHDINALLPSDVQGVVGQQVLYFELNARSFTDSNSFVNFTVDEVVQNYQILPPQAIIVTHGLDEHPNVYDYIRTHDFRLAQCFPIENFGGQIDLYVSKTILPDLSRKGC